jgi:hypothetical protein
VPRKVQAGDASAGVRGQVQRKDTYPFSINPQGGGIDGQDSQKKAAKSRQPLDLRKLHRV